MFLVDRDLLERFFFIFSVTILVCRIVLDFWFDKFIFRYLEKCILKLILDAF